MSDVDEATIRALAARLLKEAREMPNLSEYEDGGANLRYWLREAAAELVRLGERARQADKTILGLQHARRLDQHKTFDAVAKACGYTGKDWDAMLADVAELRAALAAVTAERDEARAVARDDLAVIRLQFEGRAIEAEARLAAAETALRELRDAVAPMQLPKRADHEARLLAAWENANAYLAGLAEPDQGDEVRGRKRPEGSATPQPHGNTQPGTPGSASPASATSPGLSRGAPKHAGQAGNPE